MTPDVILCSGSANLAALLRTSRSINVVFVLVSDPVAQGFVSNLAHPGGNITGFSAFEPSMAGKWLDLLKQASPGLTRVAVIFNPDTSPQSHLFVPAIAAAGSSLVVEVVATPVHAPGDFEPLIASFSRRPNSGLIFPADQSSASHRWSHPQAGSALSPACRLCVREFRPGRRTDLLRDRLAKSVPASGHLRRSHSQGCQPRRFACPAADQVSTDSQFGARPGSSGSNCRSACC